MDPVFTLQYPEFASARLLAERFQKNRNYSVFVPASRQEKGIDLVLAQRLEGRTRCLTFQVKSSKTFESHAPKRVDTQRMKYGTWFNTFKVPIEADFFLLFSLLPPEANRTRRLSKDWWTPFVLLYSQDEMRMLISRIRREENDRFFYFGFDTPDKVFLTRPKKLKCDCSEHVISNCWNKIETKFSE